MSIYKNNKTEHFEIRLAPEEKEKLLRDAAACGMTPTLYVRVLLWGAKPAKFPDKKYNLLLDRLTKLNKNIKSLGNGDDFGGIISETESLCADIREAIDNPLEALKAKAIRKKAFGDITYPWEVK